jgi:hypothetical protein
LGVGGQACLRKTGYSSIKFFHFFISSRVNVNKYNGSNIGILRDHKDSLRLKNRGAGGLSRDECIALPQVEGERLS